jgi:hypothetical protein
MNRNAAGPLFLTISFSKATETRAQVSKTLIGWIVHPLGHHVPQNRHMARIPLLPAIRAGTNVHLQIFPIGIGVLTKQHKEAIQ